MSGHLLETDPRLNWNSNNKIYECYFVWKTKVELIFLSVLEDTKPKQKTSYLRYWKGDEGIPLVKKWESTGKIDFSNPVEIVVREKFL